MNMFKIETATSVCGCNAIWDSDCIADPIMAESKEEAFELAKQYLLDTGTTQEEISRMMFRITGLTGLTSLVIGGWE